MSATPIKKESKKTMKLQKGKKRPSNIRLLIVCFAIVMIWRGMWNFLDLYFFPRHEFISNILSILIGVVILLSDDGRLDEL